MTILPRLSTIAPGTAFTDALAEGVFEAYAKPGDPLALTDVLILLPTRRAVRSLTDAFGRVAGARGMGTVLLPRIQPLGDVDEEELMLDSFALDAEAELNIAPAIGEMARAFELSQLVAAKLNAAGTPAPPDQCVALAYGLARFIDTAHTERIDLERLKTLAPDRFAEHWQETLEFLEIVLEAWPAHLKELGKLDPAARREKLLGALAERWRDHPPAYPVIAAGTTGSIPATADLLKVIAGLPAGHIVLPGLDMESPARAWDALEPSHPQFGLRALTRHLGVTRDEVAAWPFAGADTPHARQMMIHEALRPSAAADEWIKAAEQLAKGAPCKGLRFLVSQHSGEEALAIALMLREAVETPGRTAALVTPDRTLARRVSAELKRFDLNIDDSAGLPLDQTAPAAFLLHLADAAASGWAPIDLLALIKHPLFQVGTARGQLRAAIGALEDHGLRGLCLARGLSGISQRLEAALAAAKDTSRRPGLKAALDLLGDITGGAGALFSGAANGRPKQSLAQWTKALLDAAHNLGRDESGSAQELWRGPEGEKLADLMNGFLEADSAPGPMTLAEYAKLIRTLMARQLVRRREDLHPRLFIWGPLEARLQQADLIILGGLTEGVWPADVGLDPWLSRPMRAGLGLSSPERQIGLAAHDFAQLAASPEVVLSRAEKVDGSPAVPSRWWLRLENLLKGAGLPRVEQQMAPHAVWARALDRPAGPPAPVDPPKPQPPVESRPRRMSVTEVQTWLRNPYAIFARRILGLRRRDDIDLEPGPADRGTLIHDILEDFVRAYPKGVPANAREKLTEIGARHFAAFDEMPQVGAIWWPRFLRMVDWFLREDATLREGARETIAERAGELEFDVGGKPFILRARADRFDIYTDGALGIVDYKTGPLPKVDACETGLQPQLTLEAAMAARGGFGKDLKLPTRHLRYIRLLGGTKLGEVRAITKDEAHAEELAEEAFAHFCDLIAGFDDQKRPYPSQPRPQFATTYGDYDHLARRREWSDGGGESGDGGDGGA